MHSSDLLLINEIIGESDFHTTAGNTILCIPDVLGGYVAFGHSHLSTHCSESDSTFDFSERLDSPKDMPLATANSCFFS